jgi:hypothetical protein
MRLNARTVYLMLNGLIIVSLIVLGVCAYMATGFLKGKSKVVHDARLRTMVLEDKQSSLRKAKTDIEKYGELAKTAQSIVPQDKDQAKTVREIASLAAANNVRLGGITFPSSSLGAAGAKGDAQLKAVESIHGTYALNITVLSDSKVSVRYDDFINFLKALEQNRRTALVTGISLTPDTKNPGKLQFTLTINEYVKP